METGNVNLYQLLNFKHVLSAIKHETNVNKCLKLNLNFSAYLIRAIKLHQ